MAYDKKGRKNDERGSDIVSKFLEKHFYIKVENYERVCDFERQVQGIDTIFYLNNKKYTCDEKAALNYINKNLQTYALEITMLNKNDKLTEGWFVSKKDINNSFLFVWIDESKYNVLKNVNDIKKVEIALVEKQKIVEYLQSIKWTIPLLLKKAKRVRYNRDEYLGNTNKDGCKFSFSPQCPEKPVNVLVSRKKLKEIADYTEKIVVN